MKPELAVQRKNDLECILWVRSANDAWIYGLCDIMNHTVLVSLKWPTVR